VLKYDVALTTPNAFTNNCIDQPSIAKRHHDNIFISKPFRTQYEALFGEYLKSNFTKAIMDSYVQFE
jgi:hypothetical protein